MNKRISSLVICLVFCLSLLFVSVCHAATAYPLAYWTDFTEWHNTTSSTFSWGQDPAGTPAVMDIVQENTATSNTAIYIGHYSGGIPMVGKSFTLDIDVQNALASVAGSTHTKVSIFVHAQLSSPWVDPLYGASFTDVNLHFEYYWSPSSVSTEGGNYRYLKVAQFEAGTGWHHLTLDITGLFVTKYGQTVYDEGTLDYLGLSVQLNNALVEEEIRNVNLTSTSTGNNLATSISPTTASLEIGQSQTFAASVTGGTVPYQYQWFLNGISQSITIASYAYTPTANGTYSLYCVATDHLGAVATSNTATITVGSGSQNDILAQIWQFIVSVNSMIKPLTDIFFVPIENLLSSNMPAIVPVSSLFLIDYPLFTVIGIMLIIWVIVSSRKKKNNLLSF